MISHNAVFTPEAFETFRRLWETTTMARAEIARELHRGHGMTINPDRLQTHATRQGLSRMSAAVISDGTNGMIGHGHVYRRSDGSKAPCGGPGFCAVCDADLNRFALEQPRSAATEAAAQEVKASIDRLRRTM